MPVRLPAFVMPDAHIHTPNCKLVRERPRQSCPPHTPNWGARCSTGRRSNSSALSALGCQSQHLSSRPENSVRLVTCKLSTPLNASTCMRMACPNRCPLQTLYAQTRLPPTAPAGSRYVIRRGLAAYNGQFYRAGSVWGEDSILNSVALRSRNSARAMSYLEACVLCRDDMLASESPCSWLPFV